MSLFWGFPRQYTAPATSSGAEPKASEAVRDVRKLQERLDKLTLVSMAMWELLKERGELTEEELMEKVREIDLRDGEPDGKVTKLVPELDGGLFSRFDLSFDAKKVAFGYKRKDKPFRIYEIDIDPDSDRNK